MFAGTHKYQSRPFECSRGQESVNKRGQKVANKGRESALVGSPKRLRVYTTLSQPQQHSHSREKVLVNCLLQAKRVHVDCKGLDSALEAVRVSVEAVRVSIEALRCCKGLKRFLRMSIEAVRV